MSQQLELLTENPSQWTAVTLLSPEIQKKEIKPYVVLALKELEGNPDSRTSSLMNVDKFSAVRAIVKHLARLRSANKESWAAEDVAQFLEGLRLDPGCVEELTSLLCLDRVYENIPKHLRVKPGLVGLQWKIDISLSTEEKCSLSQDVYFCQSNISSEKATGIQAKEIMRRDTHIILILNLTNKQTHTYRLSINKFHELRYTVACALKNMIVLEKRKCMRKE